MKTQRRQLKHKEIKLTSKIVIINKDTGKIEGEMSMEELIEFLKIKMSD